MITWHELCPSNFINLTCTSKSHLIFMNIICDNRARSGNGISTDSNRCNQRRVTANKGIVFNLCLKFIKTIEIGGVVPRPKLTCSPTMALPI